MKKISSQLQSMRIWMPKTRNSGMPLTARRGGADLLGPPGGEDEGSVLLCESMIGRSKEFVASPRCNIVFSPIAATFV